MLPILCVLPVIFVVLAVWFGMFMVGRNARRKP